MSLLPCPEWITEEPSKLPAIAQAASAIHDFFARQASKRHILNHGDLKQWHRKLFEKVVPVAYYAGNYRGIDSNRPCLNGEARVGSNFGTVAANVASEMRSFSEELEKVTHATDEYIDRTESAIARLQAAVQLAAFAGGSIIRIHPFVNGNGRVARLAMNFFLYRYLGKTPFFINRPPEVDYATASEIAMRDAVYVPLYQYLLQIIALS